MNPLAFPFRGGAVRLAYSKSYARVVFERHHPETSSEEEGLP